MFLILGKARCPKACENKAGGQLGAELIWSLCFIIEALVGSDNWQLIRGPSHVAPRRSEGVVEATSERAAEFLRDLPRGAWATRH